MKYLEDNTYPPIECTPLHPCYKCKDCEKHNNGVPVEEADEEITLYETSLGYEPFRK